MSRKFVATAAHCIISAKLKDILVYLGELDTQDTGKVLEFAPAELHRVSILQISKLLVVHAIHCSPILKIGLKDRCMQIIVATKHISEMEK